MIPQTYKYMTAQPSKWHFKYDVYIQITKRDTMSILIIFSLLNNLILFSLLNSMWTDQTLYYY
jgi:hypothetical protein